MALYLLVNRKYSLLQNNLLVNEQKQQWHRKHHDRTRHFYNHIGFTQTSLFHLVVYGNHLHTPI